MKYELAYRSGEVRPPHDHQKVVAVFHKADEATVQKAIAASKEAQKEWAAMPLHHRVGLSFLKH